MAIRSPRELRIRFRQHALVCSELAGKQLRPADGTHAQQRSSRVSASDKGKAIDGGRAHRDAMTAGRRTIKQDPDKSRWVNYVCTVGSSFTLSNTPVLSNATMAM